MNISTYKENCFQGFPKIKGFHLGKQWLGKRKEHFYIVENQRGTRSCNHGCFENISPEFLVCYVMKGVLMHTIYSRNPICRLNFCNIGTTFSLYLSSSFFPNQVTTLYYRYFGGTEKPLYKRKRKRETTKTKMKQEIILTWIKNICDCLSTGYDFLHQKK